MNVGFGQIFKRWWWVGFLCVLLFTLIGAGVAYIAEPKQYESTALVQIKPPGGVMPPENSLFLQNQCDVIRSRNVLTRVADRLGLASAWGMDQETTLTLLQKLVNAQPVRGTDLVQIRVTHSDKTTAYDLATAVPDEYRKYRAEIEKAETERVLVELSKAVRKQEDVVEEHRAEIARRFHWPLARPKDWPKDGPKLTPPPEAAGAIREEHEARNILQALAMKAESAIVAARIPHQSVVIHEEATLPQTSVVPNVWLHLLAGAGIGGLAGCLLSLPAMCLLERLKPRSEAA